MAVISDKQLAKFKEEERAAMKERAPELRVQERANKNRAAGEKDIMAAIAKMPEPDP